MRTSKGSAMVESCVERWRWGVEVDNEKMV